MKTFSWILFFSSAASVLLSSYAAHAQCRGYYTEGEYSVECTGKEPKVTAPIYRKGCLLGTVETKTSDDIAFLQKQKCVTGSVIVSGPSFLDGDKFASLDFGELRWVGGFVRVALNPYLQTIDSEIESAAFVSVENNGMLSEEEGMEFAQSVCPDGRYSVQMNSLY